MAQPLMELLIFVIGLYLIYRLTLRSFRRADMKQKMEQVKTADDMAKDIERFKKVHPKVKDARKAVKEFVGDDE